MPLPQHTPDINGQLQDAGALTATANWQVASSDKIFDTSPAGVATFGQFAVSVKVASLAIDGNDELYRLLIQGSTSATFASIIVNLAELRLGALETLDGDVDSVAGEYIIYGHNDVGGTIYRYLRGRTVHAGATSSIDSQAWITAIQP